MYSFAHAQSNFSSPARKYRELLLPRLPALAWSHFKVLQYFYMMGNALSGELSCARTCFVSLVVAVKKFCLLLDDCVVHILSKCIIICLILYKIVIKKIKTDFKAFLSILSDLYQRD